MAPLPLPPAAVTCIQLTSLAAVHRHPSPVFTRNRPSLAPGSAAALFAESVILPDERSGLMAMVGGLGRPVWIVITLCRGATQVLGRIVYLTVPFRLPLEPDAILIQPPSPATACQKQFAMTSNVVAPPPTG